MNQNDKFHQDAQNASHEIISDDALDQVAGGFLSAGQIIMKTCNYCRQTARHKVLVNLGGYYRMRCEDCGADYCDDF
ncbi:MAG: IS1 family transposase [Clostridia bacterium]|nr:IS1 family transposase [Clostridia bacterium]